MLLQPVAAELNDLIDRHLAALRHLPESDLKYKAGQGRWSKKEIVGHLIDSAQTNIRRFVIGQYENNPSIAYDQDQWVTLCGYQQWDSLLLIDLWYLLNKQICRILERLPADRVHRTCLTQEVHTLEWLAKDYVHHLRHHLYQVLELETYPYPYPL